MDNDFSGVTERILGKNPGRGCLWGILQLILVGFVAGLVVSYVVWRLW